jgi:hypothetical protein
VAAGKLENGNEREKKKQSQKPQPLKNQNPKGAPPDGDD